MTVPNIFSPPRLCSVEASGGSIGPDPQHFQVEEIPAYPLSGQGEHVFVWVEKEGRNTRDVAKALARVAGMRERDIGYAGMKDKNAVTRQWYSLCTKADDAASWDLGAGARILSATRHGNKLRTGHLIGNRFTITLVDVPEGGDKRAEIIAQTLKDRGLPNYFGAQRFGRGGRNLAQAWDWMRKGSETAPAPGSESGASEDAESDGAPESNGATRSGRRKRDRRGGKKGDRFDNKLLPSVIQSEVFNRYIAARLADDRELLRGEVVRLDGTGTSFIVDDLAAELPRRRAGDLHLMGPMIGPKGLQAEHDAKLLEEQVCSDLGLTPGDRSFLAQHAPGTRRDLMVPLDDISVSVPQPGQLQFTFALPAGGYATQVIREFSGCDWMNPRGEAPD